VNQLHQLHPDLLLNFQHLQHKRHLHRHQLSILVQQVLHQLHLDFLEKDLQEVYYQLQLILVFHLHRLILQNGLQYLKQLIHRLRLRLKLLEKKGEQKQNCFHQNLEFHYYL
jgi:hypothetical protein